MNNEPWPHLIIDNYYPIDLYKDMIKELKDFINSERGKGHIVSKKTLFRNIHMQSEYDLPATMKCLNSRSLSEIELGMFSNVRYHSSHETYTEVNVCLDDMSYPIHDEAKQKILTAVTYLMPDVSRGTLIFDKDKNFVKEIEWKPNRTLIFAPIDGVTWHSYECIPKSFRVTINSFLLRPRTDYE